MTKRPPGVGSVETTYPEDRFFSSPTLRRGPFVLAIALAGCSISIELLDRVVDLVAVQPRLLHLDVRQGVHITERIVIEYREVRRTSGEERPFDEGREHLRERDRLESRAIDRERHSLPGIVTRDATVCAGDPTQPLGSEICVGIDVAEHLRWQPICVIGEIGVESRLGTHLHPHPAPLQGRDVTDHFETGGLHVLEREGEPLQVETELRDEVVERASRFLDRTVADAVHGRGSETTQARQHHVVEIAIRIDEVHAPRAARVVVAAVTEEGGTSPEGPVRDVLQPPQVQRTVLARHEVGVFTQHVRLDRCLAGQEKIAAPVHVLELSEQVLPKHAHVDHGGESLGEHEPLPIEERLLQDLSVDLEPANGQENLLLVDETVPIVTHGLLGVARQQVLGEAGGDERPMVTLVEDDPPSPPENLVEHLLGENGCGDKRRVPTDGHDPALDLALHLRREPIANLAHGLHAREVYAVGEE